MSLNDIPFMQLFCSHSFQHIISCINNANQEDLRRRLYRTIYAHSLILNSYLQDSVKGFGIKKIYKLISTHR